MAQAIDETHLPNGGGEPPETRLPNAAGDLTETRLPDEMRAPDALLTTGQTIGQSYVVVRPMHTNGAQATLYMARKAGMAYAVKLYHADYRPNEALLAELRRGECRFVAELMDYGTADGRFFEAYRYYDKGTLGDKGKCTASFVSDVVVPCVNEGLHYLHNVGKSGVVHGDIKPDNLFLSEDENRVVIGDFGVSAGMDPRGVLIDDMRGTPEYSPPTLGFYGKITKTAAFDYCSLGLVLIKLLTGHSLFEGLNPEAIARLWNEGLRAPSSIELRLRTLINGLIETNESDRYGYDEVKRWCEGAFLAEKRRVIELDDEDEAPPSSYLFGVFDNRPLAVETRSELFDAMALHWLQAKRVLERESFLLFLGGLDLSLQREARALSREPDRDAAVFKLLYLVSPRQRLVYRGVDYGDARAFVDGLNDERDEQRREVVAKGLFLYFLSKTGYDAKTVEAVRRMQSLSSAEGGYTPKLLYYAFHRDRAFTYGGRSITDIDGLTALALSLENDELERLAKDETFLAFLTSLGYAEHVRNLLKED